MALNITSRIIACVITVTIATAGIISAPHLAYGVKKKEPLVPYRESKVKDKALGRCDRILRGCFSRVSSDAMQSCRNASWLDRDCHQRNKRVFKGLCERGHDDCIEAVPNK